MDRVRVSIMWEKREKKEGGGGVVVARDEADRR